MDFTSSSSSGKPNSEDLGREFKLNRREEGEPSGKHKCQEPPGTIKKTLKSMFIIPFTNL